jgi:hypothetical protein
MRARAQAMLAALHAGDHEDAHALNDACERGDIAAVVALMRAHACSAKFQAAACVALCLMFRRSRADHAPAALTAASAGAMDVLLAALRHHAADVRVQEFALPALSQLMFTPQLQLDAVAQGAVPLILAALRTHATHVCVLEQGCHALQHIVDANEDVTSAATRAGALDALATLQRAHIAHAGLQRRSLGALKSFAIYGDDEDAVERLCAAGGVATTLLALRQHAADAHVQIAGWYLLAELYREHRACDAASSCDATCAFELVVAALGAHATHTGVQREVCSAVTALARGQGNRRRLRDAGVLDALVSLLRRITRDSPSKLVGMALLALSAGVSFCADTALHAGRLGAVEALIGAMRACNDPAVQTTGCLALYGLLLDPGNMPAALRAGAIPVVQAALRMEERNPAVQRLSSTARDLLAALQHAESEAARFNAADAAMAALLAEEEAERAARPAAQLKAKNKSGKKKKHGGSGSGSGAANTNAAAASLPEDEDEPAAADDDSSAAAPSAEALLGGAAGAAGAPLNKGAAATARHAGRTNGDVADALRTGSTQEDTTSGTLACGAHLRNGAACLFRHAYLAC